MKHTHSNDKKKFFGYVPTEEDREPMGKRAKKMIFELKTVKGAAKHLERQFPNAPLRMYTYENYNDRSSHVLVFTKHLKDK